MKNNKSQKEHEGLNNSFMYIVQCCDDNGYVKIGVTRDEPLKRVNQLQTGNPYDLRLVASFAVNGALSEVESCIHQQLGRFRLRGEWFSITASQAIQFITTSLSLFDNCALLTPPVLSIFEIEEDDIETIEDRTEEGNVVVDIIDEVNMFLNNSNYTLTDLSRNIGVDKSYLNKAFRRQQQISRKVRRKLEEFLMNQKNGSEIITIIKNWLEKSEENTQKAIAEATGVTPGFLSKVLSGRKSLPSDLRGKLQDFLKGKALGNSECDNL